MIEKAEMRRRIRVALEAQPVEVLEARSKKIRRAVLNLPSWQEARVVGLFAAQPWEPMMDPLLSLALAAQKRVVYPRITPHGLALIEVAGEKDLRETSRWKLREPTGDHLPEVGPGEIGLLLVPGVAFDPAGGRLGRGGGFFDRLLGEVPRAARCGVCFDLQLVPEVPAEAHDQAVSSIVTELGARRL